MVQTKPWPLNKVNIFINYKEKKENMNKKNNKNTDTKKKKSKKTKSSLEIRGGTESVICHGLSAC